MAGADRRGGEEAHDARRRAAHARARRRCPTSGWRSHRSSGRRSTGWSRKRPSSASARILPVITRRTMADKLNLERLEAIVIEAAEQCGRTALPEMAEPVNLEALARWPRSRTHAVSLPTRAAASPRANAFAARPGADPDRPRRRLHRRGTRGDPRARRTAPPISLGPRILRAETAALAALAAWMAVAGDWRPYRAISQNCWRALLRAANRAAMTTRTDTGASPPIESRDDCCRSSPAARSRASAGASAPSTRSSSTGSPTTARRPGTSPAASATC